MAVLYEAEFLRERCFHCGKRIFRTQGPAVYWDGFEHGITLHPECALHMTKFLARDARNAARIFAGRQAKAMKDPAAFTIPRPLALVCMADVEPEPPSCPLCERPLPSDVS